MFDGKLIVILLYSLLYSITVKGSRRARVHFRYKWILGYPGVQVRVKQEKCLTSTTMTTFTCHS